MCIRNITVDTLLVEKKLPKNKFDTWHNFMKGTEGLVTLNFDPRLVRYLN